MTKHRKNKHSNRSTGGFIKAGLAPSIGKQRLMRDKSLNKGVVNLTNDKFFFNPVNKYSNIKFLLHNNDLLQNNKPPTIQELLNRSITFFTNECKNKYFSAFIITSPYNEKSVFLYNKPNSPYKFISCTISKNKDTNEKIKINLVPGHTIKIAFSNFSFYNMSDLFYISVEYQITCNMPYSQINILPIEKRKVIENNTKLLTGYSPINIQYKDVIDKNNVLCNFLPTEKNGIFEYVMNVEQKFDLSNDYKLSLLTHKIVE